MATARQATIVNKVIMRPEQRLNAQLEKEIKKLSDNYMDIVASAKLGDKEQAALAHDMYETEVHAHNIVRSAEALLAITHELKRAVILNDFQSICEGFQERTQALEARQHELDGEAVALRTDLVKSLHDLEFAYNQSSCK